LQIGNEYIYIGLGVKLHCFNFVLDFDFSSFLAFGKRFLEDVQN